MSYVNYNVSEAKPSHVFILKLNPLFPQSRNGDRDGGGRSGGRDRGGRGGGGFGGGRGGRDRRR